MPGDFEYEIQRYIYKIFKTRQLKYDNDLALETLVRWGIPEI